MKDLGLFLLAFALAMSQISQGQATVLRLEAPEIVISNHQPIEAIVTTGKGISYRQTAYYHPAIEGIDLDTRLLGTNASVYFPHLKVGYIWYQNHWTDESGYYWEGAQQVHINHSDWTNYWVSYWNNHQDQKTNKWRAKNTRRITGSVGRRTGSIQTGMYGRGQSGAIYGRILFPSPTN